MPRNPSYSLSDTAQDLIGTCADAAGLSRSAWVEKAVIYYALVTGAPADQSADEALTEALGDEQEAAAADDEFRERGAA
ncbi:unnamed protein product [[Actinomadura] parvosata subsp. kistnae]|uniref:hypothetical protein n=1 Tax=[Actinomadura] parvosata TaxID=1955412 RepID=UPI000D2A4274|nr:unnamed protein product [Actinomadura parvosata subsp. kistnae]